MSRGATLSCNAANEGTHVGGRRGMAWGGMRSGGGATSAVEKEADAKPAFRSSAGWA
jgi:hypothetical protein